MPVSHGTRQHMPCLRSSKKDLQKPHKPTSGSQKVVVIKGRFQRTHRLTHQDFWDIVYFCGGRWVRKEHAATHAVVDLPWAKSGDPRLKNGPKLMKADWLIASKNGIFANSEEYQWTPEINEKATSKSHVRDRDLLTAADNSLHHSTTIKRELESPANRSKNMANISIRVEQDRLKTTTKVDDEHGYYIVVTGATFTEKWKLNVPYPLSTLLIQAADQITGLLGQGTFGRVIKAREKGTSREVAIKITRARKSFRKAARRELRVLAELKPFDPENLHQCLHMTDCFDYKGHICIVMDLLRQSVYDFLESNDRVPFPNGHIKKFARQLFKSVAYLHRRQIIHTDIKLENILFYDDSYQVCPYNQKIPSRSRHINRRASQRRELLNPKICLIDFGSATFQNENHAELVTTRYYRAPEVILELGWSFPCDIWSIGCVLVEFLTGEVLFRTRDDLEHLAMMEKVVGLKINEHLVQAVNKTDNLAAEYADMPLPVHFRLPISANLLRPFDDVQLNYPNKDTTDESLEKVYYMKSLNDIMPSETPFFQEFLDLLQKIFVYDPSKRITAKQALNHPWLTTTDWPEDDGTEAAKIKKEY